VNALRQREPRLEIPALIRAVRELPCTLRVEGVCIDRDVIAAHSNNEKHGKGKGLKSHDCFVAAACPPCHDWIDRNRHEERWEIMERGMDRTLYLLFKNGKLKVAA
jgi:hypothetical protein